MNTDHHESRAAMTGAIGTVHDLAADGSWEEIAIGFTIGSGRTVWESATYGPRSRLVRVQRFRVTSGGLEVVVKYVDPDLPVTLYRRG